MKIGKKQSVLFFTSANLACNPRCLKEVKLLLEMNVQVTVVAFHLHNWSTEIEKELNRELPGVKFYYLESTRKDFFPWIVSSCIESGARGIFRFFSANVFCAAMATSKRSWLLLRWLKQNNVCTDLIIAHNTPAFYPAYYLAKKNKILFALDIEDYHPGETIPEIVKKATVLLMRFLIPKAAYVSFASSLIREYTEKLMTERLGNVVLVNNFFSEMDFIEPAIEKKEKLQLVWFSQNIDYGRGIEELLEVLDDFKEFFELTLIGNPKEAFCKKYINDKNTITIIPSLPPVQLTKMMRFFDIGLAMEPGKDLNNTLALSNKILIYFQAGLFILASDTAAQRLFIQQYPKHGVCTTLSKIDLQNIFRLLLRQKDTIRASQKERFNDASNNSWENESAVLLKKWKSILTKENNAEKISSFKKG